MDQNNRETTALQHLGIAPARMLLPRMREDLTHWCVIACDQYTSNLEYWKNVESEIGDDPSTLSLVLPECYLNDAHAFERIEQIVKSMHRYEEESLFEELPPGFLLVSRTLPSGKVRHGLLACMDLEQYDYSSNSTSLLRPTEATIEDRIPPRLKVRSAASLELPHILLLIDDEKHSVIEPMFDMGAEPVYQSKLGFGMGEISGSFLPLERVQAHLQSSLQRLVDAQSQDAPLLYAVGDGNHSLATAKAHWESIKAGLSPEQRFAHPARYALCEIVNLHEESLVFEPIHRVVFCGNSEACLASVVSGIRAAGCGATVSDVPGGNLAIVCYAGKQRKYINLATASDTLPVALIDLGIATYLKQNRRAKVDYIHGESEVIELGRRGVAFLMPGLHKSELFPLVKKYGALPRKTFSMGEADDKRCYLEARRIVLNDEEESAQ